MNTVPVRVDLSGDPSFHVLVLRVRDSVLAAYAHQDVPFPRVLAEVFPGRPLTRTLLSGVNFNMLSFTETAGERSGGAALPGGLDLRELSVVEEVAKQDLSFTCREREDSLRCNLLGASDLFLPEELAEVARDFEALLTRVMADPEAALGRAGHRRVPAGCRDFRQFPVLYPSEA
nr:hypothetical protein [uncultured bacterium]